MASKKNDKGEPVGWVTVKGKHFPKWADGTIGWQDGQEEKEASKIVSKKPLTKKEQYKQYKDTVAGNIAKLKNSKDLSDAEKHRLVDANKKLTSKMSDISDDMKLHSKLKVPSQYEFEKEGTYTIHDGNTKRPAVYKYSQESLGLSEGIPGSEYTTHVFSDPKNPRKRYYIHEDELMKNSELVSTRQARTQSSNARYDTSRATKKNGATAEDITRDKETFRKAKEQEAKVKTRKQTGKQAIRDAKAALKQYGFSARQYGFKDFDKLNEVYSNLSRLYPSQISQEDYETIYNLFKSNGQYNRFFEIRNYHNRKKKK